MYSLVTLLPGTYPFHAMHSLHVTIMYQLSTIYQGKYPLLEKVKGNLENPLVRKVEKSGGGAKVESKLHFHGGYWPEWPPSPPKNYS